MKLLLQNKILKLDKFEGLDKIKSDEKLTNALAKIINMMAELKSLAEKHNLETKLYVGGGLEKILNLIGRDWERKFLIKYVDSSASSSSTDSLPEKQDWNNLTEFLKKQLAVREKLALVQKSKDNLGLSQKPGSKDGLKSGGGGAYVADSDSQLACHICGEKGHVKSVDRGGNFHIDYVACRKFVDWSCKVRLREILKRHFCVQCLSPGIKKGDNHNCVKRYACSHADHTKFSKALHVLLCENHKGRKENIDLLGEYMKNFICKRSDNFESFTRNISLVCQGDGMSDSYPVADGPSLPEGKSEVIPEIPDWACFQLQIIMVEGRSGSRNIIMMGGAWIW